MFTAIDVRCSSKAAAAAASVIMCFPLNELMLLLLCSFGNDCDADLDQEHSLPPMSYCFAVISCVCVCASVPMHLKWLAEGAGTAQLGAITGAARDNISSSADDALIDTRLTHCSVKCCQTAVEIDQISTSFVTRIVMKAIDLIMSSLDFRIEQMKRKKQKQRKKERQKTGETLQCFESSG